MKLNVKRVYDEPDESDGCRILVDRLWPRGLTKGEVAAELWLRDIAPSAELRKWFGHEPEKWGEFECSYFAELDGKRELVKQVVNEAKKRTVTLLYAAKDDEHNNAVAIRDYVLTKKRELTKKAA